MNNSYLSAIPEAVVEQKSLPEAMRRYAAQTKHTEIGEDLSQRVEQVLTTLSFREREVIKLRYGLTDNHYSYTLEEVGQIFNVTRERIRQIEAKALQKLRSPLRAKKLVDFIEQCQKP